jgi:hypothetical protein
MKDAPLTLESFAMLSALIIYNINVHSQYTLKDYRYAKSKVWEKEKRYSVQVLLLISS